MMGIKWFGLLVLLGSVFSGVVSAAEATGTGSMIPGPLIKVWAEGYAMHSPSSVIKYKGSNPAEGIKSLVNNEVDFSGIDMPLNINALKKNGLLQFPFALGGIAPVVNLPNVYPGQLKLDGKVLGDILLGNITKWNDPAIVELNPQIKLPDAGIIIVHRVSPPNISTIIGDYLAKTHPQWKSIKGDGMAGTWPATAIEVKDPIENMAAIKKNMYTIGYAPIPHIMKNGLSYAQMKNRDGKFISPSDENISAAAENAKWDEADGLNVVLTDQPGASSWPLSMASFALVHKVTKNSERTRETLKYFKYSLRYGGLKAVQYDYIPLPESVRTIVRDSWKTIVDDKGVPVYKD
jgi:phosphate transport system substrate-binding protein